MNKKIISSSGIWTGMAGWAIIFVYYHIFFSFFPPMLLPPGAHGFLGHDFALGLPMLLDGYFWFTVNGIGPVFWFTPSVCGGVPAFPDPIYFFYSVPQFLTFIMNPYAAAALTFVIFGPVGFWGFYVLSRRVLKVSVWVALLAATIFLFNGFYTYRFIIGHFVYHAFMLVPWCAWLLLQSPCKRNPQRAWDYIPACTGAGVIIAYMLYSGMQAVMVPTVLSIIGLCLMAAAAMPERVRLQLITRRLMGALIIAVSLGAAKISAVLHFMHNVPRDQYLLPQFSGLSKLLDVLGRSLFWNPAPGIARSGMINLQFVIERHELEYGLTAVPLVIIFLGLICYFLDGNMIGKLRRWFGSRERFILLSGLGIIVLLPIAINFYTPAWNQFLKIMPVIKDSSHNLRWFCLYIPLITLLTAVMLQQVPWLNRYRLVWSTAGIATIIAWHIYADKQFYREQSYSPAAVVSSYRAVRQGDWQPGITSINTGPPPSWWRGLSVARNDSLVCGQSQLWAYKSMFGYRLENFPVGRLRTGPVFDEVDGCLNIKNPVCYVFPGENNCQPGDHFTVAQKEQAFAFSHYRPFPFKISLIQKLANWLTLTMLGLITALWGGFVLRKIFFWWQCKIVSREAAQGGCA